jgi:hypothetical protein
LWLRQASGTDVRGVSAGHVFWFTNSAIGSGGTAVGQLLVEYDIEFFGPTAAEIQPYSYYTGNTLSMTGGSGTVNFTSNNPKFPLSATCMPYINDTMVVNPADSNFASRMFVLNHGFTSPSAMFFFIVVEAVVPAYNIALSANYWVGGELNNDWAVVECPSDTVNYTTFAVFVPAGTPADAAQIQFVGIEQGGTHTFSASIEVTTYPSVLFDGDFADGDLLPHRYSRRKLHAITQARQLAAFEEKKEENESETPVDWDRVPVPSLTDKELSEFVAESRKEKPSLVIVGKKPIVRIGEAKNPGPVHFDGDKMKAWIKVARQADITVRATRLRLAEAAKEMEVEEKKDGSTFKVSNEDYGRVFMFLISSRNPIDPNAKFAFQKALMQLADDFDTWEAGGAEANA